jgi:hypothetical protein
VPAILAMPERSENGCDDSCGRFPRCSRKRASCTGTVGTKSRTEKPDSFCHAVSCTVLRDRQEHDACAEYPRGPARVLQLGAKTAYIQVAQVSKQAWVTANWFKHRFIGRREPSIIQRKVRCLSDAPAPPACNPTGGTGVGWRQAAYDESAARDHFSTLSISSG